MSIFQHSQIDIIFSQFLVKELKAKISKVNKHYYNLYKNELINFTNFFKSYKKINVISAVIFGEMDVFLWSLTKKTNENIQDIIDSLAKYGRLEMLKKIEQYIVSYKNIAMIACTKDHVNLIKWIYSLNKINMKDIFTRACMNNSIEIVKYLYDKKVQITEEFNLVCAYGYLDLAKWLKNKSNLTNLDIQISFKNACISDRLNIVEYLYNEFNINLSDVHLWINGYNNINTMKFLLNYIIPTDLMFIEALKNGYHEMIQLFISKNNDFIKYMNNDAFLISCGKSHINIIKYYHNLKLLNYDLIIKGLKKAIDSGSSIELITYLFNLLDVFN